MARVRLPEVEMPHVHLPDVRFPQLELMAHAPFVRERKRANPLWVGFKFVVGLAVGFILGCLIAALLAPSAGEDTRQAIRDRLPGGTPKLPDESATNSGAVTRGMRVSAGGGNSGGLGARFEAAKEAMATERREHENALFMRFRRALATGRASEV